MPGSSRPRNPSADDRADDRAAASAGTALREAGRCPVCGGDRLTEIAMTLTDGSPVQFRSCRKCEAKSWEQGGTDLPLEAVMDKARKPRDPD